MGRDHHDHDRHDHGAHAGHAHAPADYGRAFAIGVTLNLGFVLIEVVCGVMANSMSLLADAGHNLGDVLGLVLAWVAAALVKRPPSGRFTYGLRGASILAALANAIFLLVATGAISWEAAQRLAAPQPVAEQTVIIVALAGVVVNGGTALLFASGGKGDINIRGAFLHLASDAAISAGVVVAALVIALTGWLWLDPLSSLVVNALIIWSTWGLLREGLALSMAAAPAHIDLAELRAFLAAQPGVAGLHDLHVWPMSTTEAALTCHLETPGGHPGDAFLRHLAEELAEKFGVRHVTVQIETDPSVACALAPEEVV